MGNPLTKAVGKVLTRLLGNYLTEALGKVLDIYNIYNWYIEKGDAVRLRVHNIIGICLITFAKKED